MAKISCPGCGKQYNVPATAAGKTATCKACGKKFQLGKPKSKTKKTRPPEQPVLEKTAAVQPDDDFWDEAASADIAVEAPTTERPRNMAAVNAIASAERELNESVKPNVRWGFQWGKVFLGLAIAIGAGGLAAMIIINTGRLRRGTATLIAAAMGGVFMMINGLMGEEGIW